MHSRWGYMRHWIWLFAEGHTAYRDAANADTTGLQRIEATAQLLASADIGEPTQCTWKRTVYGWVRVPKSAESVMESANQAASSTTARKKGHAARAV
jgi:hypothetical protein